MRSFLRFVMAAGAAGLLLAGCGDDSGDQTAATCDTKVAACETGGELSGPKSLVGRAAPELSGDNITGTGETGLAAFAGKPVAVVFWVNICPHCIATMPKVDALQASFGAGAQIFSVAIHDPEADGEGSDGFETPSDAAATMRLAIPTIVQERSKADGEWHLAHLPTAFILNGQHVIVEVIEPDASGSDIVAPIEAALRRVL